MLRRGAYSALLRLLLPVLLLRLLWRSLREPLYRAHLGERLGWYPAERLPGGSGWVWLHAVSLGETRAAAALVQALRRERSGLRFVFTHGTATGREAGRVLVEEGDRQVWQPLDTPGACRRFLAWHRPVVGVLMETEVWPNLIAEARAARVPMILANARLSERSLAKARRMEALMREAAESLTVTLAQTEADAQRLHACGAAPVHVVGNLKFDMAPDAALLERGRRWAEAAAASVDPAADGAVDAASAIVLAASTREGEEQALLQRWAALPVPRPRLLVVPRHPQRFDEVAELIRAAGFACSRRSTWPGEGAEAMPDAVALSAPVWLGDSLGEMPAYYAAAGAALLGGSFEPLGGQNLIEAAACGCPVVMGPHTFNFLEAARLAAEAGAAVRVADLAEGVERAVVLARGDAQRQAMQAHALAFSQAHRGAAMRMAREVLKRIDQTLYRELIDRGRAEAAAHRARRKQRSPER